MSAPRPRGAFTAMGDGLTRIYALLTATIVGGALTLAPVEGWLFEESGSFADGPRDATDWALLVLAAAAAAYFAYLASATIQHRLAVPLRRLSQQIQHAVHSDADNPFELENDVNLGELGGAISVMLETLDAERRDTVRSVSTATDRLEVQKSYLERTIRDLSDAIIVWNLVQQPCPRYIAAVSRAR